MDTKQDITETDNKYAKKRENKQKNIDNLI
jgi:hypothetical protein